MDFNKRKKIAANSMLILIISVLIGLTVAYLSTRHYVRLDVTENKQYTLSDVTKDILTNLDDNVIIKVFFSKNLPPNTVTMIDSSKDLLEEISANSKHIDIQYLDPSDKDIEQEAIDYGIPKVQMNVVQNEKYEIQDAYLGIVVLYENKSETIPVVSNNTNLEYDLMTAIQKVRSDKQPVIGFLTGHGEHSIDDQTGTYATFKSILTKQYDVQEVDVSGGTPIEGVDTLIIAGATEPFSDRDIYEVDQFIMNGGNALFLLDGATINQNMEITPAAHGLDSFLAHYGLRVNTDMVTDFKSMEQAPFTTGYFPTFYEYPFWVRILKENINTETPVLAHAESFVTQWVSSVDLVEQEGIQSMIIASTTQNAKSNKYPFNLNPTQEWDTSGLSQIGIAALSKGVFTSYYADQVIPPVSTADDGDTVDEAPTTELPMDIPDDSSRETKQVRDDEGTIVLFGDSDFATSRALNDYKENALVLENVVDSLTIDQSLLSISAKQINDRPLNADASKYNSAMKFLVILFVPLLVAIFGILRMQMRKKKRSKLY